MPAFKDLTGQRFGHLVVEERAPNINNKVAWKCKCDCGNIKIIRAGNLIRKTPSTVSCGCKNGLYLPGMQFGDLTVIKEIENSNPRKYLCKCSCGNEVIFKRAQLTSNVVHYCGDKKKHLERTNFNDLTGQKFGKLTVLKPTNKRIDGKVIWLCKCECGNIIEVLSTNLLKGNTVSCGCVLSKGEEKINQILSTNNISYVSQKTFPTFKYPDGDRLPRFDFYINNSYLIEYDGGQHFIAVEHWGGQEQLKIQQQRDEYKNQWCKENNMPLIRIPYWHYNDLCLEDLLLETTQFRVV